MLMMLIQIVRQVSSGDVVLTQVCMSRSGRMMFTGTSTGMIRAIRVPLTDSGDHQDYPAHAGSVSRVSIEPLIIFALNPSTIDQDVI